MIYKYWYKYWQVAHSPILQWCTCKLERDVRDYPRMTVCVNGSTGRSQVFSSIIPWLKRNSVKVSQDTYFLSNKPGIGTHKISFMNFLKVSIYLLQLLYGNFFLSISPPPNVFFFFFKRRQCFNLISKMLAAWLTAFVFANLFSSCILFRGTLSSRKK